MKFFFLYTISILFIISCQKGSKANEWTSELDDNFLSTCIVQLDQNIKYCDCVLDKLKVDDKFDLTIENFNRLLNDNENLKNILNDCASID